VRRILCSSVFAGTHRRGLFPSVWGEQTAVGGGDGNPPETTLGPLLTLTLTFSFSFPLPLRFIVTSTARFLFLRCLGSAVDVGTLSLAGAATGRGRGRSSAYTVATPGSCRRAGVGRHWWVMGGHDGGWMMGNGTWGNVGR
jgi:hypothetical protein